MSTILITFDPKAKSIKTSKTYAFFSSPLMVVYLDKQNKNNYTISCKKSEKSLALKKLLQASMLNTKIQIQESMSIFANILEMQKSGKFK